MTLRKIRALMVLKGIKIVDVARAANVSPITVSIILTGKGKSKHIQSVIAELLGKPYEKVWAHCLVRKAA